MTNKYLGILALLLAIVGVTIGAYSLYQGNNANASFKSAIDDLQSAQQRLGVTPLQPAKATQAKNVVMDPSKVPPPINRTENTTVEVNLTVQEVTAELADGATYTFWTFNGTVPGPLVRVMEGDTVKLTLTNPNTNLSGHNIDLHAVIDRRRRECDQSCAWRNKNTDVQGAQPRRIHLSLRFLTALHARFDGKGGGIIVEPKGGLPKVDREFYVVQGEWYTAGQAGDKGHQPFSTDKARAESPEFFTFNGHVDALTKIFPLMAKSNETIRIFFGVGGPNVGSNFHVIGEIFDKVYTGDPKTFVANEETWYVPPGSMSIFEFRLNEPGQYLLVDHALWRVAKGAAGALMVEGTWNPDVYSPPLTAQLTSTKPNASRSMHARRFRFLDEKNIFA